MASVLAGEPRAAVSPDGVTWTVPPAGWFPGTLAVLDLVATASGFAAVGNRVDDTGPIAAWSGNGRAWTGVALDGGGAIALYPAGNGVMAAGGGGGIPGTQLWWASLDGRARLVRHRERGLTAGSRGEIPARSSPAGAEA